MTQVIGNNWMVTLIIIMMLATKGLLDYYVKSWT